MTGKIFVASYIVMLAVAFAAPPADASAAATRPLAALRTLEQRIHPNDSRLRLLNEQILCGRATSLDHFACGISPAVVASFPLLTRSYSSFTQGILSALRSSHNGMGVR